MKKILGISLCALFAVSAANAEIASTEWVEQQVGNPVRSVTTGSTNGTINVDGTPVSVYGLGSAAYTSSDDYATAEQGGKADTALQPQEVTTGTTNGTINVDGTPVSVYGLGTAAYTSADAYATAAQGAKADDAVLEVVSGTANGTIKVDGTDVRVTGLQDLAYQSTIADADVAEGAAIATSKIAFTPQQTAALDSGITGEYVSKIDDNADTISRLGTAAYTSSDDYATAEQGGKADTALQPQEVTTGTTNGTINVDGTPVSVYGLGTAAYTSADAYATAAQGAKADDAVLEVVSGTANGTIKVDGTDVRVTGLQDLAYQSTIADADVAEGAAIATSKISFTREQANALDSGITSTLVGKITANESAIGENTTNIASNATNITNMGTQVTTNKTNITDLQGRMTTAEGKITNNTTAIKRILEAEGATTCDDTEAGCTLVLSSAGLKWEKVTRAAQ